MSTEYYIIFKIREDMVNMSTFHFVYKSILSYICLLSSSSSIRTLSIPIIINVYHVKLQSFYLLDCLICFGHQYFLHFDVCKNFLLIRFIFVGICFLFSNDFFHNLKMQTLSYIFSYPFVLFGSWIFQEFAEKFLMFYPLGFAFPNLSLLFY